MKAGIYSLFSTDDLKGCRKYRWGRIFRSPLPAIAEALAPYAIRNETTQYVRDDHIEWIGENADTEALFCFVPDPSNLDAIERIYALIRATLAPVAFVIVHQRSDSERAFDIFRLSERSYLEHHNRVYSRE